MLTPLTPSYAHAVLPCSCGICLGLISLIRRLICVCDAVPEAEFQLSEFLSRGCHQSKGKTPCLLVARVPRLYLLRRIEFGLFLVRAAAVHGLCQLLKIDFQAQTAVRLGSNIRNDFINDHKLEESSMTGVFSLVGVGIWVKKWIDWII